MGTGIVANAAAQCGPATAPIGLESGPVIEQTFLSLDTPQRAADAHARA